ncbi:hypothetical protein DNU06_12990 [Putridiphycobacter roseus]|uniref:Secretion system C-terminal sorting domain-containing protein n=1 Tax=Putridiphycobacter roseus TaxID=2219161 RepID=A0A2W1NPB2_9FLAO|nr:T9SS type A sorting domain-containing protein [Putridiphycobacter roseus]PZE16458.1 hypothetical protein DNU06_12990 [Putridiphycobacter roseus]
MDNDYFCAVRQQNDTWLFIPKGNTQAYLLYDFDVVVGDTINVDNPWASGPVQSLITSIDSVLIQGGYRDRLHLDAVGGGFPEVWIAGIGSSNGLFYSGYYIFDYGFQLMCFHENDSLKYMNAPNNDCNYQTVGIEEVENSPYWSVYPNPVSDSFEIKIAADLLKIKSIKIYDNQGRMIRQIRPMEISNVNKIEGIDSGLYLVSVVFQDNEISTKKVVVL